MSATRSGELEAILFAAGDPIDEVRIAEIMNIVVPAARELLLDLEERYAKDDRGIMLRTVAGGYQLCTKAEYSASVEKLSALRKVRLTNAALETLAIIAYKQPVTKAEIEAIRGVNVDKVVNTLAENGLICEMGRKEALGRPLLYGTTERFLTTFGLNALTDLPAVPDDFTQEVSKEEAKEKEGADRG